MGDSESAPKWQVGQPRPPPGGKKKHTDDSEPELEGDSVYDPRKRLWHDLPATVAAQIENAYQQDLFGSLAHPGPLQVVEDGELLGAARLLKSSGTFRFAKPWSPSPLPPGFNPRSSKMRGVVPMRRVPAPVGALFAVGRPVRGARAELALTARGRATDPRRAARRAGSQVARRRDAWRSPFRKSKRRTRYDTRANVG